MSEELLKTPCAFGENGNFLLERELGRGGMGGVYMGRDKMLDRPVAVKVMLKQYGADAEFVEKFKKEAQSAAKLIHPNIAQIYSYGISEGMPYIAMELVAGGSLWSVMQSSGGKPDVTRVLKICQQVAQALQCSTDLGFVHGDIKPENILLDANGNAKLVDFGLAGMQKNTEEIWGTPYYISPEKIQQTGVDFRSDMYNLGGTLYHALTNKPPFDGEDVGAVVRARFAGAPPKPSEIRSDLTPAVDALVMRMLELDKDKRFPSFEALIEEFKKVLTSGLEKHRESETTNAASTGEGTTTKRTTVVRGGRRVTTVRKRTTAATLASRAKDPDLDDQPDEEDEEGGGIGAKALLFVLGGILLIGAVAGGLIWFRIASEHSKEAAAQAQVTGKVAEAQKAIAHTREQAVKLVGEVDAFAERSVSACKGATGAIKKLLPDWADELQPPPSDELLKAIASTNETPKVEAKQEEAVKTNATEKAEAKAAPKKMSLAMRAKRCGMELPSDFDPASPEAQEFMDKLDAKEKELDAAKKKDAEPKEEQAAAQPQEEKKDRGPRPKELDDLKTLWNRAYSCRASAIKVRHRLGKIVAQCDEAAMLTGDDKATLEKLAAISTKVSEAYGEIRAGKDVENVSKGISLHEDKCRKVVSATEMRLKIAKREQERKEAKEAEEAAEKKKAEDAAAAKQKLIDEEVSGAKAKFDSLVAQGVLAQLDWEGALRELKKVKDACKTPEGGFAADYEIHKVETMKMMQDLFRQNLPGYVFKKGSKKGGLRGNTVRKADGAMIEMVRSDGKTPQKLTWRKLYKEYHGNLNELINTFIVKGRENGTKRLNLKEWADAMCGAALTVRIVCADSPSAASYGESLVKQVYDKYPEYQKNLKAMFPDVAFEGGAAEETKAEDASADENKTENTEKEE